MIPRFKPWLGWPELLALFRSNKGAMEHFEREFAQAFQAADAVAFPYGRSAQWAFFKALGIEGGEVIMPAYTCSVVAHAVTLSGNQPRFVDIRLNDYNMDLDRLPSLINEHTRAIIATHTFGYPQDLDRLETLVREAEGRYGHKIWLMQDCCHAFGATWNGRMIGTSGDVAVYAFNISKMMTSIFGGMLTFQDPALASRVRQWRDSHYQHPGILKALKRRFYLLAVFLAFREPIYGLTWWLQEKTSLLNRLTKAYHLDEKIHFPPDYLDRMLDVEAAVGLAQLRKYPAIVAGRREMALWLDRHLPRGKGWVFPPLVDGATYSHYVIRTPDRARLIEETGKMGLHLGQLIQYSIPVLACYGKKSTEHPNSHLCSLTMINLPLTPESRSEVHRILTTIGSGAQTLV